MDIRHLIDTVKKHPEFDRVGMILCHNGIVRATSRDGRRVNGLEVSVDHDRLNHIIAEGLRRPGIVAVEVSIIENRYLRVGEDVMVLVVAGEVRETVLSTLQSMLEAIKTKATCKIEHFA